jgi:pyrroloquinoline quinone (PQQ) biosynthesis protein C
MADRHSEIIKIDEMLEKTWKNIMKKPEAIRLLTKAVSIDKRIYGLYLIQIYNWANHVARSLGLAGANTYIRNKEFMDFAFSHGIEEAGHELMAVHDLKAIGVPLKDDLSNMPPPLPRTEALIGYINWIVTHENPIRSLGFFYWIERPYDHIRPVVQSVQKACKLTEEQMSFFYAHEELDQKHGRDLEAALVKFCHTEKDWEEARLVMNMSQTLLIDMIVYELFPAFDDLKAGKPSQYDILNQIEY